MPKYKFRKSGSETKISKGKCASVVNFDILQQCVDDDKILNGEEEAEVQVKTDEEPVILDTRTSEEIMMDAFETFDSKSSQTRSNALTIVGDQLQASHNPEFLTKHFQVVQNMIENALLSNMPLEIDAAARLISLAAIQLPMKNRKLERFYGPLKDLLKNKNIVHSVGSTVCYAIGMLTFLYETDAYQISVVMKEFNDMLTPDPNIRYESQDLIAALETWTFLLSLIPDRSKGCRTLNFSLQSIDVYLSLLGSACSKMRINCAKAIAVIFECGLDCDKKYLGEHLTRLTYYISSIANTWKKPASDTKSAKEVLRYLENGIAPSKEIRYGKSTLLKLDSWALNIQYEMLSNVIGPGNVAKHLSINGKLLGKMSQSTKTTALPTTIEDAPSVLYNKSCERLTYTPSPQKGKQEYDYGKISKNFELATHKLSLERTQALQEICQELHLLPHTYLEQQRNVLLDIILKGIKRGNENEQLAAVRLATLTVLQLGREERFCSEISTVSFNLLKHSSTSISTTASMCTALAFFELVDHEHSNRVTFEPIMSRFRQIFSENQTHLKTLKGDSSNEQANLLRIKALEAWGLLLTLCSPKDVCSFVKSKLVQDLTEMLDTPNVEFRVVCAQVISLIIEQGRMYDKDYLKSDIPEICSVIKDIVNDRKRISSEKRKMQNPKLTEIVKYLEDGCHPPFKLRFGDEIHELKTRSSQFKYQQLVQIIGPNLSTHLLQNERIRGIIQIGQKQPIPLFELKPNVQYKLSCAAQKKSKTKENRLHSRMPKFGSV